MEGKLTIIVKYKDITREEDYKKTLNITVLWLSMEKGTKN